MTHDHGHAHDETKIIDIGDRVALLSIFEDGVPPRFRIHLEDPDGHPAAPWRDGLLTVETVRDDGSRETFSFTDQGDFREAAATLPEPHEFFATLSVHRGGHTHVYEARFLEQDHGRDHAHSTGVRGLVEGIFRHHSHDAADSIDNALDGSAEGIKAVRRSLWALGLTAILQLVVVVMSGSVALLADTIHNFADASTAIPLWLAFSVSRKAHSWARANAVSGRGLCRLSQGESPCNDRCLREPDRGRCGFFGVRQAANS